MRLRRTAAVLVALTFGVIAPVVGGVARGAEGTVGLKPAHSDPADPATLAYFKPTVNPGASFADAVVAKNSSGRAVDLLVSAVDGLTGQTTGAVFANRQDPVTKAGAWVTPAASRLHVPAHASVSVAFRLDVPSGAGPGDYLAGLAFEDADPTTAGGNFAVTQITRSVMAIQIKVPGPAAFDLRLDGTSLESLPDLGRSTVVIKLTNHGNGLGKPMLSVALAGPNGYAKTVDRQLDTILPGDSIAYPLVWPEPLDTGDYTVSVTAGLPGSTVSRQDRAHLGTTVLGATATAPRAPSPAPAHHPAGWADREAVVMSLVAIVALSAGLLIGRHTRHA